MKSPSEIPLSKQVPPGDTLDIQIVLFSPMAEGNYTGNWMIRDESGALFGVGDLAKQPLTLSLIVQEKPQVDKFPAPECGG